MDLYQLKVSMLVKPWTLTLKLQTQQMSQLNTQHNIGKTNFVSLFSTMSQNLQSMLIQNSNIQVFVMLSDYIKKGQAYVDENRRKLSLYHTDKPLQIDYISSQFRRISILTLNYCHLHSLKGIEQFQQLEQLNIKFNNISEVPQLYRIKNKEAIIKLQFVGNEIEYLGAALFVNLIKIFPNLIEMNGRNYLEIVHHRGGKNHSMKKILTHSNKLQKQMAKTIRRQMSRNQVVRKNYASQVVGQGQTKKYILQEETNEQQLFESRSKYKHTNTPISQNRRTRKKQYQSSEHNDENQEQSGLKENHNFNNLEHHDRDVSLGAISNIPMTKSVRASVINNSHIKLPQKNKGLQIFVLNQSMHSQTNHNHYAQPTATFAMQRQKQNLGFDFREKKKSKKYQNYSIPIEEYHGESKYELKPTKRQTNGSFDSDHNSLNFDDSQIENNLITNPILLNERETLKMARHYYEKHVEYKVFMALRNLPKKKNLPMRLTFQ